MNCIFVIICGVKGLSDGGFRLYMRDLRLVWGVVCPVYGACDLDLRIFPDFTPHFLRDETDSGRGVHRFWGVLIQKSRSLFGHFFGFYPNFGVFGVGVLYWALSRGWG